MENAMLTFDNVSAHYGKIQALHNVSLHIKQGEIVTLIGANGAGKTTLLGTLCGDPRASSGRIVFDGKDITDWQTAKIMREAVAIVPEGRRVFSRMTVEENLAMGGFFADRDQFQTRIKWVYELFPRLHERRIQRAGTMSGGEQQMLAIGRALMSQPRLLLLDEPSLGLAPIIIQQIFDTIEQLREQGMTIFLVEQNANQALKLADRGYVLENLNLGAFTSNDKARIRKTRDWIFELFPRLMERKDQLAGTLSGGEQQMLAIGRALMSQPRLLLLDEPSLGLAPIIIQQIFDTIEQLREQGMTIFLVEQNANQALKLADRGYVLENGHVVLEDTGDALLANEAVRSAYLGG